MADGNGLTQRPNFQCSEKPTTFQGHSLTEFKAHMEHVCTELLSVATNYRSSGGPGLDDPRTCLSAYTTPPTGAGYLLAVRESTKTPSHILHMAQELHAAIQEHYQLLGEGKPDIGDRESYYN